MLAHSVTNYLSPVCVTYLRDHRCAPISGLVYRFNPAFLWHDPNSLVATGWQLRQTGLRAQFRFASGTRAGELSLGFW